MKNFLAMMVIIFAWCEAIGQWTTSGSNAYNTNAGNVGVGTSSPSAILDVQSNVGLGTTDGNATLISRLAATGNMNYYMNNKWMYRDGNGSDWWTARLVDGISIDGSFLSPFSSRTWWYRDPFNGYQSFGDQGFARLGVGQSSVTVWGNFYVAGGNLSGPNSLTCGEAYSYIYHTLSDASLKENPQTILSGLDLIKKLNPKEYNFKKGAGMNLPEGKHSGLYAQELQKVLL